LSINKVLKLGRVDKCQILAFVDLFCTKFNVEIFWFSCSLGHLFEDKQRFKLEKVDKCQNTVIFTGIYRLVLQVNHIKTPHLLYKYIIFIVFSQIRCFHIFLFIYVGS